MSFFRFGPFYDPGYRDYEYDDRYGKRQKEGKVPIIICSIISLFALVVLVLGFIYKSPYLIMSGIVPAALYEAWRTQGCYTKTISMGIVALIVLEILAILGYIQINLAETLGKSEAYFAGQYLPLGDIKFIFPLLMVMFSGMLVRWTYGIYTKWLSIVLFLNSAALLYVVNRDALIEIIKNFI